MRLCTYRIGINGEEEHWLEDEEGSDVVAVAYAGEAWSKTTPAKMRGQGFVLVKERYPAIDCMWFAKDTDQYESTWFDSSSYWVRPLMEREKFLSILASLPMSWGVDMYGRINPDPLIAVVKVRGYSPIGDPTANISVKAILGLRLNYAEKVESLTLGAIGSRERFPDVWDDLRRVLRLNH